jgi:hypothetical protein
MYAFIRTLLSLLSLLHCMPQGSVSLLASLLSGVVAAIKWHASWKKKPRGRHARPTYERSKRLASR